MVMGLSRAREGSHTYVLSAVHPSPPANIFKGASMLRPYRQSEVRKGPNSLIGRNRRETA